MQKPPNRVKFLAMNKPPRFASSLLLKLLSVAVTGILLLSACGGDDKEKIYFPTPSVRQGNTLTVVVYDLQMKNALYYQDSDGAIYTVKPTDPANKLAAVRVQVYNGKSNLVKMNVNDKGYTLLDKAGKEYEPLNPFGPTRRLEPNLPSTEELRLFIWGEFEIPKGNSIEAWTVFEIPPDVMAYQLRWNAVETVFVPFYPLPGEK